MIRELLKALIELENKYYQLEGPVLPPTLDMKRDEQLFTQLEGKGHQASWNELEAHASTLTLFSFKDLNSVAVSEGVQIQLSRPGIKFTILYSKLVDFNFNPKVSIKCSPIVNVTRPSQGGGSNQVLPVSSSRPGTPASPLDISNEFELD